MELEEHIRKCPTKLPPDAHRHEAAFQSEVIRCATGSGFSFYHTHDSRRSPGGFPDLVLVDRTAQVPIIFAELKTARGRVSPNQRKWLRMLKRSPEKSRVVVWRPSDWMEIRAMMHREKSSKPITMASIKSFKREGL